MARAGSRDASTNSRWRSEITELRTMRAYHAVRQGDGDNHVGQPGAEYADHKNDRIEVGKVINISATRMVA
ncbi:hypothetical protein ECZU29_21220 [Escherichia coli]|nr:hypothetical protein ECZU29_21220 [Escherichia coli]